MCAALKGEWAGQRAASGSTRPARLVYAAALGALMFGLSRAPPARGRGLDRWPGSRRWRPSSGSSSGPRSPVLDVRLFTQNRVFGLSNLAALINYSATFAVGFLLSLYLQHVRGLGARRAGPGAGPAQPHRHGAGVAAGRVGCRTGSSRALVASAGMGLTVVGLVAARAARAAPTPMAYHRGVSRAARRGLRPVLLAEHERRDGRGRAASHYGVAAATLGTMRLGGQMLSMGVAMSLLTYTVGPGALSAAKGDALVLAARLTFGLFAVLCTGGVLASAARGVTVHGRDSA